MRRVAILVLVILSFGFVGRVLADEVTPNENVKNGVVIRRDPSSSSPKIGILRPGEHLPLAGSVPGWNQVTLTDGHTGYVSKTWTVVTPSPVAEVPPEKFTVHIIDVGTGLAVFVEGPGFALVYDGGSNDDTARGASNRLLAYIRAVRPDLTVIDQLILSHPHRDHVELLPDLFAAYEVRNVWDSGRTNDICGYRAFILAIIGEPNVIYHDAMGSGGAHTAYFEAKSCYGEDRPEETLTVPEGSQIVLGQPIMLSPTARMTFLAASPDPSGSPNENSLVMMLQLGPRRVLFMGDAEAGGRADPSNAPKPSSIEGELLACCASQLRADILIAGHHGSMTSSRAVFVAAVAPTTSIISSGPTRYGSVTLPDAVIVDELAARGPVFRTNLDDAACAVNPAKIGPDNDGQPGGCDNIQIIIDGASVQTDYWRGAD